MGGSRAWLVVAVVTGALKVAKKLNERADRERIGLALEPGETIELSVVEPGKRGRKPQ